MKSPTLTNKPSPKTCKNEVKAASVYCKLFLQKLFFSKQPFPSRISGFFRNHHPIVCCLVTLSWYHYFAVTDVLEISIITG